jgi:hypothetical protein
MTGMEIVPIAVSWILVTVLGIATVVGLNGLNRERATEDA